jgi:ribonuclease BN (tRNA processing enzyme)
MNLTVLGSGTAVPHPTRSSAGFWLETSSGGSILLDCSASAVYRMAQENLDWANLDAIWISHFHLDHCGGIAPFLFGTKNAAETQNRQKPFRIFGAKGLRSLIDAFDKANNYNLLKQPFPVEIIEIESLEKFEILPNIEAVALDTPHTEESLAIHLRDEHDKTIVYTSDTGFDESLITFAGNVDLLVMECSFFKNKPVEKHLELREAMLLTRRAKPKSVMLTHLYPEWDAVDFQKKTAEFAPPCEIIQAIDGLRLKID